MDDVSESSWSLASDREKLHQEGVPEEHTQFNKQQKATLFINWICH